MIIELNAFLYCFTFLIYYNRVRRLDFGVLLLGLYAVSSVFSVLFFHHPLFHSTIHYSILTISPFFYLYIVLLLFFLPLLKISSVSQLIVNKPDPAKLLVLIYIIVLASMVRIIYTMPHAINMLVGGADLALNKIMVMGGDNLVKVPFPLNLLFVVSLLISKVSVLVFFYIASEQRFNFLIRIGFAVIAFLPDVLTGMADSSRASLFGFVVNVFFCYLLFRHRLTHRFKVVFQLVSAGVFGVIFIYVVAVTLMRFGSDINTGIAYWQYKYFGESFINFNGLLFNNLDGLTMGDRNFTFFRNLLGFSNFSELSDIRANAENITGIPGYIFYLFVGHLIIDFGEIIVFVLALSSFLFFKRFFNLRESKISFAKIFIIQFYFRLCFEGLFYFPYAMHIGNLQIVMYVLLYLFFRYDLVGAKLEKV